MLRIRSQLVGRRGLDDLARVHDRDAVRELEQQREVVRDEEDRAAEVALQVLDLLEDLALHDDVERRRRLVHDQQLGAERESHRNDHALTHPTGELMGKGADAARIDADDVEQLLCTFERHALRHVLVGAHHVDETGRRHASRD